jgi:UDP-2,3-diacylglucosamine pyrophosphatase LpxH
MKNQLNHLLILIALSGMITITYSFNLPGEPNKALTIIKTNVEMSENIANPPVNNSVEVVQLTFSEALDMATIQGSVKLFRIDAKGIASELPCYLRLDFNNPAMLNINTKPVQKFADGVEYKIEVSGNLKSKSGATMSSGSSLYFATNVTPGFSTFGNSEVKRNKIVVISDIHLGMDSKFAEINKNFNNLVDLLTKVRTAPDVKELVIGGDLMDQWFVPMNYKTPVDEAAFVDAIAANNKPFVDAIVAIIKEGKTKVTYAPGNHDITVTEADIARVFPGINQARGSVQGLGEYVTGENNSIVIEHGHKYNFFCAPDPISIKNATGKPNSIMPPGYFFTRIATSSIVQGKPKTENTFPLHEIDKNDPDQLLLNYYYMSWKGILETLPVKEKFSEKVILTNIDGLNDTYSMSDVIPQYNASTKKFSVKLYDGLVSTWEKRQEINGVKAKNSAAEAILGANDDDLTDLQAKYQYFDNDPSKRIVIFGHTHKAKILPFENLKGQKTIYANSGTWIDHSLNYPNSTFVVVTEGGTDSPLTFVNLYQYTGNGTVTQWGTPQAITH